MIWVSKMDTEHFEFVAHGTTEDEAREKMARVFEFHCRNYTDKQDPRPFDFWNEDGVTPPSADNLHDYYGIRTYDLSEGDGFIDGSTVTLGEQA